MIQLREFLGLHPNIPSYFKKIENIFSLLEKDTLSEFATSIPKNIRRKPKSFISNSLARHFFNSKSPLHHLKCLRYHLHRQLRHDLFILIFSKHRMVWMTLFVSILNHSFILTNQTILLEIALSHTLFSLICILCLLKFEK